jgi:parvulin-like peptidyl-prolyl isomerase
VNLISPGKEEILMAALRWTMAVLAAAAGSALLANRATAQAPAAPAPPQAPAAPPPRPVPATVPVTPATPTFAPTAPAASAAGAPTGVAGIVNGESITLAEVEAIIKTVPAPPVPPTDAQKRQMRQEVLEMLIDDTLVRQYLTATNGRVSQADFNREYEGLLTALKAKNMTLQDFLRDTSQTEERLRLDIVKKLQWDNYVAKNVNDAALQTYYNQNRDYYDQVTVQASHILIRVSPKASESERAQARARLLDLRQKILAGQLDFAEAAKKFSQCQSAPSGGDLGSFRRKWAVDETLARAAFALPVGQVSDVVQTDSGFHLIKVTGRKPGQPSTFEAVKEKVREDLAMEMWHDLVVQQRKIAKIESKLP